MSDKGKEMAMLFYVLLVIMFIGGIGVGYLLFHPKQKKDAPDITITTKVDKAKAPKPTRTIPKGYVQVPVVNELPDPEEPILPENKILIFPPKEPNDSAHQPRDTLSAYVPIHQKEYRDSNYTAYVSGFNAKLDSLMVKTKVITVTQSVTKYRTFNVGLTGGLGYGLTSRKPDVWIGVGVTWKLFKY